MSQRLDPIAIVPYDPMWPALFERERDRVEAVLGPWLVGPIEHIGSTSVSGLAAKPIIDMVARITNYDRGDDTVAAMVTIGWMHAPEPHDHDLRRWSFCFPDTARRTHHLHVVEDRSPHWRTWLAFRDHLRRHPADAAEYARIKALLAASNQHDRPSYRAGKAPFIQELLRQLSSGNR